MTAREVRWELAALDPTLVHPRLAIAVSRELRTRIGTGPEAVYAETLVTMADSDRMAYEFAAALAVLNPLLDARLTAWGETAVRLDAHAAEILRHARSVRDARSGMACDLCLQYFDLALDAAKAELGSGG
ncbi:hypothetical protein EON77_14325 [bacterium]|nr:MAG: hypothetical protein EON77_14325 [bacterium]